MTEPWLSKGVTLSDCLRDSKWTIGWAILVVQPGCTHKSSLLLAHFKSSTRTRRKSIGDLIRFDTMRAERLGNTNEKRSMPGTVQADEVPSFYPLDLVRHLSPSWPSKKPLEPHLLSPPPSIWSANGTIV